MKATPKQLEIFSSHFEAFRCGTWSQHEPTDVDDLRHMLNEGKTVFQLWQDAKTKEEFIKVLNTLKIS